MSTWKDVKTPNQLEEGCKTDTSWFLHSLAIHQYAAWIHITYTRGQINKNPVCWQSVLNAKYFLQIIPWNDLALMIPRKYANLFFRKNANNMFFYRTQDWSLPCPVSHSVSCQSVSEILFMWLRRVKIHSTSSKVRHRPIPLPAVVSFDSAVVDIDHHHVVDIGTKQK